MSANPDNLVAYGPDTNCTLALCPVDVSVLQYRPSLAASGVFIGFFAVAMALHLALGLRWRRHLGGFTVPILLGLIDEIIGYIGRIIMHGNPFSFSGFLMQIICITTAPVFFCAAIYVTLSRTIIHLDASLARFNPKFLIWFFIPCDVISLVFQAVGGALSSTSTGSDDVGVNISLFGLSFQVFTLVVFIAASLDYLVRFRLKLRRSAAAADAQTSHIGRRLQVFLFFLSAAIIFILVRCIYRIDELSSGYNGSLFHNEGIFYGLESAMIVLAIYCLCLGHPGFGLQADGAKWTGPATEQSSERNLKSSAV